MTDFETILLERKGRVGIITLNRPEGAQRAQLPADARGGRGGRRPRRATARSARSCSPGRSGPSRPAPTSRRWQPKTYMRHVPRRLLLGVGPAVVALARPIIAAVAGLRARRRLRAGDDVRLHHRRRHRQVRSARDQARCHPRHRRLAASDPRGRQGQGDGHVPDRSHHGRRGGRARRPRLAGRPGRRTARRGARRCRRPSRRCRCRSR